MYLYTLISLFAGALAFSEQEIRKPAPSRALLQPSKETITASRLAAQRRDDVYDTWDPSSTAQTPLPLDCMCQSTKSRRQVLDSLLATSVLSPLPTWAIDAAADGEEEIVDAPDFHCLADLGPVPEDAVRVYACRHGQTENNRLRLVQGSRMNPPLNDNGLEQARRLGQALKYASVAPTAIWHSSLERARQTAVMAASQITTSSSDDVLLPTGMMESIAEVDFGPSSDGTAVEEARSRMIATYTQWAFGKLDVRMASDGESGLEVLQRVEKSMEDLLTKARESPTRCIAFVSHSTFLRTLLATVQNIPLTNVASIEVRNASISVIDIKTDGSQTLLGPQSRLFGGPLSRADKKFRLSYPSSDVVRVNEKRHLGRWAL